MEVEDETEVGVPDEEAEITKFVDVGVEDLHKESYSNIMTIIIVGSMAMICIQITRVGLAIILDKGIMRLRQKNTMNSSQHRANLVE